MAQFTGTLLSITFFTISIIHIYWGLGGKWGTKAAIPTTAAKAALFKPGPISCFTVALTILGFGILVLNKTKLISLNLPHLIIDYGLYALALIFILRAIGDFKYIGFTRKINNTLFARMDQKYYSPLCLLISILLILTELFAKGELL